MKEVLSVKNLNKSFGKNQVLFNVNFNCQKGRIVGLIGANGAGKTTIMKAILSLTQSRGQIKVNGQLVTFDSHLALDKVGALIEYPGIYPFLTGHDHLKLFASDMDDKLQRIQNIIDELKMNQYIDKKAKGYSLGMKQKLGIAMAFVNNPNLVILDEPMNGLDPQATKDLRELILNKSQQGVTFLISSHILGELQKLAEDLIVIDHGKIIQKTTMQDLLANNQHYVILKTDNDSLANEILLRAKYEIDSIAPLKIVMTENQTVEKIMNLLRNNNINVQDIQHIDADLEESVLKLISSKG